MDIEILGADQVDSVGPIWQKLERRLNNKSLICSWLWTKTWLDVYGRLVPHWFLIGKINGKVVALVLLTHETGRKLPIPIKAFHIGTAGEPFKDWVGMENNYLLVSPKNRKEFVEKISGCLAENYEWEEFKLDGFESTQTKDLIEAIKEPIIKEELCPIVNLKVIRQKKSTILDSLSHATRYSIRRSIRGLGDDLQIDWAGNVEQAMDILKDLSSLHQRHWESRGKKGMFASCYFTKFHNLIIPKLLAKKSVILFRVRSKRLGVIGCLYLFLEDGVAYGYQSGFRSIKDLSSVFGNAKRLKPGFVTHFFCLMECLKKGVNEYNFGAGSEPYKLELATDFKKIVSISSRRSKKVAVRDFLIATYFSLEKSGIISLKKMTSVVKHLAT